MRPIRIMLTVALAVAALVACSDETQDKTREALRSVSSDVANVTDKAAARAIAEELRAALRVRIRGDDARARDVSVLNEVVEKLPGSPDITGISDRDGDGRDDDGKVEAHADDQAACLTISPDGTDTRVTSGACA